MNTADIVKSLTRADDAYHNGIESHLTDADYDNLRRELQLSEPAHPYLTGVGSDVRGGKIDLPYQLGSLNQVHEGEVADWISNNKLSKTELLVTEKLDGVSALVIYDKGELQIAYSRGNGVQGADITRHVKNIVDTKIDDKRLLAVRGEIIISKPKFADMQKANVVRGSNKQSYKNARNAVAGMMNASTTVKAAYKYIDFVAYDILNIEMDKEAQIDLLHTLGMITPMHAKTVGGATTDESLTDMLNEMRDGTDYEIDGIVVDVDPAKDRARLNPTRETLNPGYAVKYKVATLDNYAESKVVDVEWNVSKDGYLKPRICVEPVELMGVTVKHATGFNAKYIRDNKINVGSVVAVQRMGDVVPNVVKVVKASKEWAQPDGAYRWSENDVDIITIGVSDEQTIQQMIDVFSKLEIDGLREGNVRKLFEAGYTSVDSVLNLSSIDSDVLYQVLGKNGEKVAASMNARLTDIPLWKLMGSRTDIFGRGIGRRKCKKLCEAFNDDVFNLHVSDICTVEGFEEKTAQKIVDGLEAFENAMNALEERGVVVVEEATEKSSDLADYAIVLTGIRDKELQEFVEANGGKVQSAVSSKTTHLIAADPKSTSGKAKKAIDLGISICGLQEFRTLVGL